jgi:hypothetical protein
MLHVGHSLFIVILMPCESPAVCASRLLHQNDSIYWIMHCLDRLPSLHVPTECNMFEHRYDLLLCIEVWLIKYCEEVGLYLEIKTMFSMELGVFIQC